LITDAIRTDRRGIERRASSMRPSLGHDGALLLLLDALLSGRWTPPPGSRVVEMDILDALDALAMEL
jgi:hypothetical protein